VLQQKYGHIIENKAIAPPPTGPPANFSSNMHSTVGQQPPTLHNRYVAYDYNQPVVPPSAGNPYPAAPQQQFYQAPPAYHAPPPQAYQMPPAPQYTPQQQQQQQQQAPPPHPQPSVFTPNRAAPHPNTGSSNHNNNRPLAVATNLPSDQPNQPNQPSPPGGGVSRLLANKGVPVDISMQSDNSAVPVHRPPVSPHGEDVIQMNSNSSSVL
jgi:hypothetical protein